MREQTFQQRIGRTAIAALLLQSLPLAAEERNVQFTICRLKYGGGGDWYANPSSLPNLLEFIREETGLGVAAEEARAALGDEVLYRFPYLYMTGHGNVRFSDEEAARLRTYLLGGGFLHADDNYGMDASFRREMKRVFPDREWVELPTAHPIYHTPFDFPDGLPKIHEHDGKPPLGLGLFNGERLMVFYTVETDLGDGWEDPDVHNDPPDKRLAALRMGTNIFWHAFTH